MNSNLSQHDAQYNVALHVDPQRKAGDHAGSEASDGVMIRFSLNPVISIR